MVDVVGLTASLAGCSKSVTVTLAGSASGWYTDAIKTASATLSTDSDGYTMTVSIAGAGLTGPAVSEFVGGCLATATSNAVCIHANRHATEANIANMKVYSVLKAKYLATAVLTTDGV